ncbi:hypothetical protein LTR08_003130 [Meristemomyces frigidus]|nr:hypothetical protein LTR08_003130 [Meristemomyces frigidus]
MSSGHSNYFDRDPNAIIAEKAAESLRRAQRNGEVWAFWPGKKALFGYHHGESPSLCLRVSISCVPCWKMGRHNPRATRAVLRAIHEQMMHPSALFREMGVEESAGRQQVLSTESAVTGSIAPGVAVAGSAAAGSCITESNAAAERKTERESEQPAQRQSDQTDAESTVVSKQDVEQTSTEPLKSLSEETPKQRELEQEPEVKPVELKREPEEEVDSEPMGGKKVPEGGN